MAINLGDSKGILAPQWSSNEEAISPDMNVISEVAYKNFTNLASLLTNSSTYGNDFVLSGLQLLWTSGKAVTVKVGVGLSYSGKYFDAVGNWAFQASTGEAFSVVLPADYSLTFTANTDPTNSRIDLVQIRPNRTADTSAARSIIDPVTQVISSAIVNTRWNFAADVQIVVGTVSGSPVCPATSTGWIKLGEVTVPPSSGDLTQSSIVDYRNSENWTTSASSTITQFGRDWSPITQYRAKDFAIRKSGLYIAVQDNIGHDPNGGTGTYWKRANTEWNSLTTYKTGDIIYYSGTMYSAVTGSTNQTPVSNPTYWSPYGAGGSDPLLSILKVYTGNATFEGDSNGSTPAGYSTYNDGASATPVDGTGGTPTSGFTFLANSTSPLIGNRDAILTKPASNCQGQGASYDFTLDTGILGQSIQIDFYVKTSANFASGDVGVYIYDKTNSVLVPVSINDVSYSSNASRWIGVFYPTTSTSYRLIFHVQTTNASAWTLEIDNVAVSVKQTQFGLAGTGGIDYTPTFQGIGTVTGALARYWRVGNRIIIDGFGTTGSSYSSSELRIYLPTGLSFYVNGSDYRPAGTIWRNIDTTNTRKKAFARASSGLNYVTFSYDEYTPSVGPFSTAANGDNFISPTQSFMFHIEGEITQWSVNINTAEEFTEYASSTNFSVTDTTGANNYNGSEGSPFAYDNNERVYKLGFQRAIQPSDKMFLEYYVNGKWIDERSAWGYDSSFISILGAMPSYTPGASTYGMSIEANDSSGSLASNEIWIRRGTYSFNASTGWNFSSYASKRWRVRKTSGGNLAEVPPVVRAEYYSSDASAINTPINFATKSEDTNNNVITGSGTWRWTCSIPGVYLIALDIWAATSSDYALYINGASYRSVIASNKTSNNGHMMGAKTIRFKAGDYMDIRNTSGTNLTSSDSTISITRIGS